MDRRCVGGRVDCLDERRLDRPGPHRRPLERSTLCVFALSNASLTGAQMAERYAVNLNRIVQRARRPGLYVYVVMPNRLERRWRP